MRNGLKISALCSGTLLALVQSACLEPWECFDPSNTTNPYPTGYAHYSPRYNEPPHPIAYRPKPLPPPPKEEEGLFDNLFSFGGSSKREFSEALRREQERQARSECDKR